MLTHMGSGSFESRVMAVRAAVAEQNPQSWGEAFAIGMTLVDPAVGNVNALLSEALTEWADGDWGEPVAAVSLVPFPFELEPEPEPEREPADSSVALGEDLPAWFIPDPDPDWPDPFI